MSAKYRPITYDNVKIREVSSLAHYQTFPFSIVGHCRNVRTGKVWLFSVKLLQKLTYSNRISTKFQSFGHEYKYLEEESGTSSNITQNRQFLWTEQTSLKIIRVCIEFCNGANRPFSKMAAENSNKLKSAKIKNVYQHQKEHLYFSNSEVSAFQV